MSSPSQLVRYGIATQLRLHPAFVTDDQRLREDLALSTLDLVWIVMRVEALELGSREFPVDLLSEIATVGELAKAFEEWSSTRDTYEEIDFDEHAPDSMR